MLPKYAMGIKIQVCRMQSLAGGSSETGMFWTHSYNKANKYDELDAAPYFLSVIIRPEAYEVMRAS